MRAAASPLRNGGTPAPRFTLVDDEEEVRLVQAPVSHRPQAAFNVDIEDNGDDLLMAWEQYSKPRTLRCCGREIALTPPDWWYRFTKTQRRWMICLGGCMTTFTLLLLILVAAAAARKHLFKGGHAAGDLCDWTDWRLPPSVHPHRYNLTFDVQMDEPFDVQGEEGIEIHLEHPSRCVVLHVTGMQVVEARLGNADGPPAVRRYNDALEQLTLEWDSEIPAGHTALYFSFKYRLSRGMSGFYRSVYPAAEGDDRIMAATQFEANSARAAFPCFDEPELKAEFAIEVITSNEMVVLSNMPTAVAHHHDHQEEGMMTWHFQPSPPMSTYLVAIVIGQLASAEREVPAAVEGGAPRKVAVWGVPDQVSNLEYAADAAAAILPAYERAFGIPYSLPKLDLVAIPDFSAGAMENWGLITYRQTALLVSPTSSLLDQRYVTKLVAHEMAHQWFGDLTTMAWWSDLWLNEGLASYLEFLGADAAHPALAFFEHFYIDDVPYALYFDSKAASHPMSPPAAGVNSTDRIEGLFDPVEYEKGATLLRMLRAWINRGNASAPAVDGWESSAAATGALTPATDPFLLGLSQYLQQYQYNATTAPQFWTALSAAVGVELGPLMEAWTYAQGYPMITVSVDAKRSVWVQQAPFALSGPAPCDSTAAWWVPISFVSSEATGTPKWMELNACQSLRPLLPTLPKGGWVKVNARQYGYYRVNYVPELWDALALAAVQRDDNGFPVMKGVDVAGLLEDSYTLAEAGVIDILPFLQHVKALPHRPVTEYSPWAAALPYLYAIDRMAPCSDAWRTFVRESLIRPFTANATVGAAGPSGTPVPVVFSFTQPAVDPSVEVPIGVRLLRPEILKAAGYFGETDLVSEATQLLTTLASASQQIGGEAPAVGPDVLSVIYQTAAHSSPEPEQAFRELQELYLGARVADQRDRVLRAMSYSPLAAPKALEFALTPAVKAQDVRTLVVATAAHAGPEAARLTWDWFKTNWDRLHAKLGGDAEASRRMGQILEGVASASMDAAMLAEVDEVYTAHQDKQSEPGYAQRAKEVIQANAKWVHAHGESTCAWVAEQQAGAAGRRR